MSEAGAARRSSFLVQGSPTELPTDWLPAPSRSPFWPVLRCGQVGFASGLPAPFGMQPGESDGVQMVVVTITIMSSILTVLGYALYRSWFVKRPDYADMI